MIVNKNGIMITLDGIARQDGVIGQTIRVKSLSTHKLVKAMVMEDGSLKFLSLANNS